MVNVVHEGGVGGAQEFAVDIEVVFSTILRWGRSAVAVPGGSGANVFHIAGGVFFKESHNHTVNDGGMQCHRDGGDHFLHVIGQGQAVAGFVEVFGFIQGDLKLFQEVFADDGVGESIGGHAQD